MEAQNNETLYPKDFCFYLEQDPLDGDTVAYFCPLKFFKENGSMSEEYYDALDEHVPEDMDEIADNCYATAQSMEDVEKQLVSLGFVKDEEFWSFMEDIDGSEEAPLAAEG